MDISVIIPVYNTEKYLPTCIDSVICQENVTLEIILVDDGSTDSSGKICEEYAYMYPNIHIVHIENSGPATAKNVGLKLAKGDYISFTDSDDKLEPTMFHEMVSAGRRNNSEIICCNFKEVDAHGNVGHTDCSGDTYLFDKSEALRHILSKDLIYTGSVTKIFKRELLTQNNLTHNDGLKTDEDFIMNIKAFAKCNSCTVIDKCFYIINYREDSLSHSYFKENIDNYINNRFIRSRIIEKTVSEECPELMEWAYLQNIMYFNELLGRMSLYHSLYFDKRTKDVIDYIRNNWIILRKYHSKCGFSKVGCYLIKFMPPSLYMYYRGLKTSRC
jgi:glycosyltransferase involved in cell wall biosynthesis